MLARRAGGTAEWQKEGNGRDLTRISASINEEDSGAYR